MAPLPGYLQLPAACQCLARSCLPIPPSGTDAPATGPAAPGVPSAVAVSPDKHESARACSGRRHETQPTGPTYGNPRTVSPVAFRPPRLPRSPESESRQVARSLDGLAICGWSVGGTTAHTQHDDDEESKAGAGRLDGYLRHLRGGGTGRTQHDGGCCRTRTQRHRETATRCAVLALCIPSFAAYNRAPCPTLLLWLPLTSAGRAWSVN